MQCAKPLCIVLYHNIRHQKHWSTFGCRHSGKKIIKTKHPDIRCHRRRHCHRLRCWLSLLPSPPLPSSSLPPSPLSLLLPSLPPLSSSPSLSPSPIAVCACLYCRPAVVVIVAAAADAAADAGVVVAATTAVSAAVVVIATVTVAVAITIVTAVSPLPT